MMRYAVIFISSLLFAVPGFAAEEQMLTTEKEKVNYSIGVYLANTLKSQGIEFDPGLIMKGFSDSFAEKKLLLDDNEISRAVKQYQLTVRQKQGGKAKQVAALANKTVGERFMSENREKPGVVVLPNGLQYKILRDGSGQKPKEGETVEYNFRGTLLNGKEVVSSYKAGKPALFKSDDDAIQGVAQALRMMRPGAKWQLFVPPQLAFGEEGQGSEIGPNSTLIYEVEFLTTK